MYLGMYLRLLLAQETDKVIDIRWYRSRAKEPRDMSKCEGRQLKKCRQKRNTHLLCVDLLYSPLSFVSHKHQETGAVLKDSEIGHAYEFGNEAEVRNILEPNPWEAQAMERDKNKSQKAVDHVLEDDKERRQREDEGEHLEEEGEDDKKGIEEWLGKQKAALPKIVARTRVSAQEFEERNLVFTFLKLQFSNEEVSQFRSMGIEPREHTKIGKAWNNCSLFVRD